MTATVSRTTAPLATRGAALPARSRPVGLGRLTAVELRKAVDTRAGRWLLAVVGLVAVAATAVAAFGGQDSEHTFENIAGTGITFAALLLPVVGVLLVTSEWSQRTALTTFTLVPRRGRIVTAKLLAGVLLGIAATVVCLALGAIGTIIAPHAAGATTWDLGGADAAQMLLYLALFVTFGVGFGLLFLNSPIAIVTFFVLPTAWTIASNQISVLHDARDWVDTSTTFNRLVDGTLSATHWAQVATSFAVWLVVPIVVGTVRVLRRPVG